MRNIISIHAPARGATGSPCYGISVIDISIHAPARGATSFAITVLPNEIFQSTLPRGERQLHVGIWCIISKDFNPRSREGSDFKSETPYTQGVISIHAPARGATKQVSINWHYANISIHAPARGATIFGSTYKYT